MSHESNEVPAKAPAVLDVEGHCPICLQNVRFVAKNSWLRDSFLCSNCGSIPRERALMVALEMFYPNWRELVIHESSPVLRGVSKTLKEGCANYLPTQYFVGQPLGEIFNGVRCENLEKMTFADESIDLHISQDVAEHVFDPSAAFKEIARTLRPGGAHVFTVPIVRKQDPSRRRAVLQADNTVRHIEPAQYHGNPVDASGALVTIDWGYDILSYISEACGLNTIMLYFDDLQRGLRAEYIEVLITRKPSAQRSAIDI